MLRRRFRSETQYAWVDMARAAAEGEAGQRAIAEEVAAAFAEPAHRPTPPPPTSGESCALLRPERADRGVVLRTA